jgi:hypothetical protein
MPKHNSVKAHGLSGGKSPRFLNHDTAGYLSGTVLGYGLYDRGFESRQGLGIFLSTTVSRRTMRPTQPPIQWILGALSLGVKRPGREADHSPPSSVEVKECVNIYLHSPLRLQGVVLN